MLNLWVVGLQIPQSASHLNGKGDKKTPPPTQGRSLPTTDQAAGHRGPSGLHQVAAPTSRSFPSTLSQCSEGKVWGEGGGRFASFCHAAPFTRLPGVPGDILGEVSHRGVWQGCFSSSTVPLCAFGSAVPNTALPPNGIHPTWQPCPELALTRRSARVPRSECAQLLCVLCF